MTTHTHVLFSVFVASYRFQYTRVYGLQSFIPRGFLGDSKHLSAARDNIDQNFNIQLTCKIEMLGTRYLCIYNNIICTCSTVLCIARFDLIEGRGVKVGHVFAKGRLQ